MFVKMMVQEILREDTIFIDIYPETHPADALDKHVPPDLALPGAACATDIVNLGLDVIAFGGHAQDISASSFCLGLGVENDEQAAEYLTSIGCGHHPVLSRILLYIIMPSRVIHAVDRMTTE